MTTLNILATHGREQIQLSGYMGRWPRSARTLERLEQLTLESGNLGSIAAEKLLSAIKTFPNGRSLSVSVEDTLGHYFMFERPSGIRTLRELKTLALATFERRFELSPIDWLISIDSNPFSAHCCAFAIRTSLSEIWRETAQRSQLRFMGIEPQFVAAFNTYRAMFSANCWIVFKTMETATVARIHSGALRGVRVHGMGTGEGVMPYLARDGLIYSNLSQGRNSPDIYLVRVLKPHMGASAGANRFAIEKLTMTLAPNWSVETTFVNSEAVL
jgi:hypothetical protein